LIEGLAIEGFAVAKVDYPNKDKELLPSTRINSAVRVIRHNAAKFNVDKNKIGAFGFSKGSSTTAFLAFDNEPPTTKNGFYYEESDRIQAALLMASRFDLFQAYNDPKASKYAMGLEKKYGHPEGNSEIYAKFSPINYLTEKAPPIFLSVGALDLDRTEQVRVLATKLKELNVPFIYTEEPSDKHKVTTNPETVKAINNFFKDWLGH
jgi:acetyl esterase/lipase